MTAQVSDSLLIDGYQRLMACEPLASWLYRRKKRCIHFKRKNSACDRGYVANWSLDSGRLFLENIYGHFQDGRPISVQELFSNYSQEYLNCTEGYPPGDRVKGQFAFWFSGVINCSFGELLFYEHTGYDSVYDKTLQLYFEHGMLKGQRILENKVSPSQLMKEKFWKEISEMEHINLDF